MLNYAVIYEPVNGQLEVFGPFKTVADAKSWMAQTFNDNCEMIKKSNVDFQWTWSEEKLGSCKIENFASWKVVTLTK